MRESFDYEINFVVKNCSIIRERERERERGRDRERANTDYETMKRTMFY